MQKRQIVHSVEAMEKQAETILNEARAKADNILSKANKEADEILNGELIMDEVDVKCQDIINKARSEADKKKGNASKQISRMKVNANKNIEEVVKHIIDIVSGAQ
jgi:vacuolar-type H+-ATPase subunit H